MVATPTLAEQAESRELTEVIRAEIRAADNWISFEHFMQLALYTPKIGYYAGGRQIFGPEGDYVTAPSLGGLFSACLGRQLAEILGQPQQEKVRGSNSAEIVEFGAGTGDLAAELLAELDQLQALPQRYSILETGPGLRARQQARIAGLPPRLASRVRWLSDFPSRVHGVILANEVLDAMPFHRFRTLPERRVVALGVQVRGERFCWAPGRAPAPMTAFVQELDLPSGYESEWNRQVPAWVSAAAACLERGVLLLIDYGYDRRNYYRAERSMGTLRCHYRHQAHEDPFLWPGLQDITAHVDFSGVCEAARAAGLELLGYADQARFLIGTGFAEVYAEWHAKLKIGSPPALALAAEAKRLTLPQEMGEPFKCIAFGRHANALSAFSSGDQSHRLVA